MGLLVSVPTMRLAAQQQLEPATRKQSDESKREEVIRLTPFSVTDSSNTGYGAQMSNSSSRMNLRYVDVPQSVSVMTSEFLSDAFIFDSREFVKYVTGLQPRSNYHGTGDFFIRGLLTSVSYIDGFMAENYNRDAAFYDRIEYVKGPAAAAMGASSAGGSINYISKLPTRVDRFSAKVTVGDHDFYRAEGDYNKAFAKGALSIRVPFYWEDRDDARGSGGITHRKKWGVGPALLWNINPQLQLIASTKLSSAAVPAVPGETYWSDKDVYKTWRQIGVFPATYPWTPFADRGRAADPVVSAKNIYGITGFYNQQDVSESWVNVNYNVSKSLSVRTGLRYSTLDAPRDFIPADAAGSVRNPANPADVLIPFTGFKSTAEASNWRSQTDVIYSVDFPNSKHSLLAGFDWFTATRKNRSANWTEPTFHSLYNLNVNLRGGALDVKGVPLSDARLAKLIPPDDAGSWASTWAAPNTANIQDTDGRGHYANYTGTFFERFIVMAGYRQDYSGIDTLNLKNNVRTPQPTLKTGVPRYSFTYKPTANISVYYLHSEQKDPAQTRNRYAAFTQFGGATYWPDADPRWNELITSAVAANLDEIGVKVNFLNGRATATVAVYDLSRKGFLFSILRQEVGHNRIGSIHYTEVFANPGESLHGVEAEMFGQITPRLTIYAGYNGGAGQKFIGANPDRFPMESLIDTVTAHGKYSFRNSERSGFDFTLGGKYFFKGFVLWPGASATYSSNQYLVDAGVSYHWMRGKYTAALKVNNLMDTTVYITPNSLWGHRQLFLSLASEF